MLDAPLLIEVAAKSLVVAGMALAALRLTQKRSAAERSLIGHLGLVALIVLPAASLLVPGWNPLPASVQAELRRLDPDRVVVLGSAGVVSNNVIAQIQAAVGG